MDFVNRAFTFVNMDKAPAPKRLNRGDRLDGLALGFCPQALPSGLLPSPPLLIGTHIAELYPF